MLDSAMVKGQNDWQQLFNDFVTVVGGEVQDLDNPLGFSNGCTGESHATVLSAFGLKIVVLTVAKMNVSHNRDGQVVAQLPDNLAPDEKRNYVRIGASQKCTLALNRLTQLSLWANTSDLADQTGIYGTVIYLSK